MIDSTIAISKLDAARRQTETAITMWFHDGDPVSLHTLGSAALAVLHDLGDPLGKPAMVFDKKYYREEMFDEWKRKVKEAQNFFKHADRKNDPDEVLHFRPSTNKWLLFDCADTYFRLTDERTPVMDVFWRYFIVYHPKFFNSAAIESLVIKELRTVSKHQFFTELLPMIQARGTTTA